jgi:zinc/manganese transport system substrate-binding protein
MRPTAFITVLVAAALAVAPRAAWADLDIVTTTADLGAIARAIGGEHVKVTSLALPTQDPHFVDARPHLALKLARADLLVVVGLDLEVGWLPTLQTASRNGRIQSGGRGYLDTSGLVDRLEVPTKRIDRSMGDVHPGGNPHFMFDPRQAAKVARGMARRMAELDPDNADCYQSHERRFQKSLTEARGRWGKQLAGLRGVNVIAYHKSFPYLADWLRLRVVEHIEPRPGIPPNPRHVARVLTIAKRERVRMVLQESFYPSRTGKLIASRAKAKLVRIPGGPNLSKGQTYIDFIDRVAAALRKGAGR